MSQPYLVVDSPYEVARWRPLVNWVLFIPHAAILYVFRGVASVVFVLYWFTLLFTGKLNPGMYGLLTMYERYNARAGGFLIGYSEIYPPFDFIGGAPDNYTYPPVALNLPEPTAPVSRVAALNVFKAIPHYVVVMVYGIGAGVVLLIAWFAVLFTGAWPKGMRDWMVRLGNYYHRVWTYVAMVDNSYPKFGLPTQ